MKMVCHIQELLAHKNGPDPHWESRLSYKYYYNTQPLLRGKDDRKCKVVKNCPAETQNAKKVLPKEGKESLKEKEF